MCQNERHFLLSISSIVVNFSNYLFFFSYYKSNISSWLKVSKLQKKITKGPLCNDGLELPNTSLWKLIVCVSSKLYVQWYCVGSVKSIMMRLFTPWKLANVTKLGFLFWLFVKHLLMNHCPQSLDLISLVNLKSDCYPCIKSKIEEIQKKNQRVCL